MVIDCTQSVNCQESIGSWKSANILSDKKDWRDTLTSEWFASPSLEDPGQERKAEVVEDPRAKRGAMEEEEEMVEEAVAGWENECH